MEIRNVRARLIATEARRVAMVLDGLPADRQPSRVRERLYSLQSAEETVVPGWLVGAACAVPIDQRSGSYVLTTGDNLIPERVARANAQHARAA